MSIPPIPEGFATITPYLPIQNVPPVIEFLTQGLGAREIERTTLPNGRIANVVMQIGDSKIMLGETPGTPMPGMLYLYVEDSEATYKKAIAAGGTVCMEMFDAPYGDRVGAVQDVAGNQWWIASRKENIPPEEVARRMADR